MLVFTVLSLCIFFFFNDTATTEIYTLSLHDALPIHEFAGGLARGAAEQVEEALLHVGDGAPEGLAGELVVGDVDVVHQGFEIAGVLAEEVRNHAALEDGDEILHVLGEDHAFHAIGGAGAQEELLARLQQLDGSNLDGGGEVLMQIEDGLLVLGDGRVFVVHSVVRGGDCKGRSGQQGGGFDEIAPVHRIQHSAWRVAVTACGSACSFRDEIQRGDAENAEKSAEFDATEELRGGMGWETPEAFWREGAEEEYPQEWGHGSLKGYATVLPRRINGLRRGFRREDRSGAEGGRT